eukprot:763629-Pleurochrysis_carterae.AAC.1
MCVRKVHDPNILRIRQECVAHLLVLDQLRLIEAVKDELECIPLARGEVVVIHAQHQDVPAPRRFVRPSI